MLLTDCPLPSLSSTTDRTAEQCLQLMAEAGVQKSLIVQPILFLYDHSCACVPACVHSCLRAFTPRLPYIHPLLRA